MQAALAQFTWYFHAQTLSFSLKRTVAWLSSANSYLRRDISINEFYKGGGLGDGITIQAQSFDMKRNRLTDKLLDFMHRIGDGNTSGKIQRSTC